KELALGPPPAAQAVAPDQQPPKFETPRDSIKQQVANLETLSAPRMFVGFRPIILVLVICIVPAIITQLALGGIPNSLENLQPQWQPLGIALGGSVVFCIIGGLVLRMMARAQVKGAYLPLRQTIEDARKTSDLMMEEARGKREKSLAHATKKRDGE